MKHPSYATRQLKARALTMEQAREIRRCFAIYNTNRKKFRHWSAFRLSKEYGVQNTIIYRIVRNQHYKE